MNDCCNTCQKKVSLTPEGFYCIKIMEKFEQDDYKKIDKWIWLCGTCFEKAGINLGEPFFSLKPFERNDNEGKSNGD